MVQAQSADFPEKLRENGAGLPGVVVEEYLEGREFSVEGLVVDGASTVIAITEKHTGRVGDVEFAELAHVIPARGMDAVANAAHLLAAATNSLGVRNAVVHLEAKYESDRWTPIEIGLRPAGDRIPLLLSLHAGIDLFDLHGRAQLGLSTPATSAVLPAPEDRLYSALVFASSEAAWCAIERESYPMFPPGGDPPASKVK